MRDSIAYINFRNFKGKTAYIRLITDSGYIFLKSYRLISLINKLSVLRPLSKVLSWFFYRLYSCEISLRANINGPVIFPHPLGIVIGDGVILRGVNTIYQNVTLGQNNSMYPILKNCIVYPGSVIAGKGEYNSHEFGALSRVVT